MKSQPFTPHIIQYNAHRNTMIYHLSLMMQNPDPKCDFHIPPNCRMVEPNLSSSIHHRAIFQAWMWDLIENINRNSSRASIGHPPQPIKYWFHLTVGHQQNHHPIGLYPILPGLQSIFSNPNSRTSNLTQNLHRAPKSLSNQGSKTSNSTHSFYRAPKCFSNQGSRIINSIHQGLQSVFPTKATRLVTQPKLFQGSK